MFTVHAPGPIEKRDLAATPNVSTKVWLRPEYMYARGPEAPTRQRISGCGVVARDGQRSASAPGLVGVLGGMRDAALGAFALRYPRYFTLVMTKVR